MGRGGLGFRMAMALGRGRERLKTMWGVGTELRIIVFSGGKLHKFVLLLLVLLL